MDTELIIGKVYEYVCPWSRPVLTEAEMVGNLRLVDPPYIQPHQTFVLIGKRKQTKAYIKVYITETYMSGWIYTGVVNGLYRTQLGTVVRRIV